MTIDKDSSDSLWKELKLLQPIVDKFDDVSFRIKNWFITIFFAVSGYSIANDKPELLILNLFMIFIFYFYEITYRTAHKAFLTRSREIQAILRNEKSFTDLDKAPHVHKYLFQIDKVSEDSKLLKFFSKLGLEEKRAKKSAWGSMEIYNEATIMLTQLRVSFIYIAAFAVNIILTIIWLIGFLRS